MRMAELELSMVAEGWNKFLCNEIFKIPSTHTTTNDGAGTRRVTADLYIVRETSSSSLYQLYMHPIPNSVSMV